ncbi:Flp pilus assembly protein CpaB [Sphingomonas hankyongi]|uniref:Flp pilus assembly protein CpaB n=1 Tax=Sphingomonas hankyongi TaxID=2908209 RepID=A0ABT0S3I0_9SPHN|nr:Flp pilus assembly protein CpaB [Sphingomonas hankyongi]MCL6730183.1 Flp pilus assembly protein CpaB [Sphingomonas hankyongi]
MLSRQTIIALGVAVVLGILAVFLANSYLVGSQRKAELAGTTKVAVATSPLTYGTDVTADKVRFVDYPNTAIPPGAFTNAAQLMPAGKKRVALMAIGVNEPILASKISGTGQGASIAALLPEGMRAASVRINDVSGVAGFVQPNDSVDVLITRDVPGGDRKTQMTDVLLQNVRVIAIDQRAKNADGSAKVAKTATLEVSPLDAQKLALAQEVGSLSLVLRKPGEQNNPVVETISLNDLRYNIYGGARYPAPAVVGAYGGGLGGAIAGSMSSASNRIASATVSRPARKAPSRPAAPAPKSVQIYRGVEGNEVKVGGNGA